MSSTRYVELDCSIFRFKWLKFKTYNKSMGEGEQTRDLTQKDEVIDELLTEHIALKKKTGVKN